ncbi:hypothetical protein [Leptobacterium sp. I13]|uniref:hypothetical protein n=1 Tax=Leptobacterium meishanense TaxID=3128904 RepID=UPI0030EE3929
MKLFNRILLFTILFAPSIYGQTVSYEKGIIIDSIPVDKDSGETFALYLPRSYNPVEKSAIVFIYEPAARGRVGVEPFIEAAELYNYILICSNNSKNGPYEKNFEILNSLFTSVFNQFDIDANQVYTAGFSGGSRLAVTVAVLTGEIQGVIACGGGFSSQPEHIPSEGAFSYVGLVGYRDMNYREMIENIQWLDRVTIENELFTYDDEHNWPPSDQIIRAFDWLEIQAYKKGIRKRNDSIIEVAFYRNYQWIDSLKNQKDLYRMGWEYKRLVSSFRTYMNTDTLSHKYSQLKKNKLYKKQQQIHNRLLEEEIVIVRKFRDRFYKELETPKAIKEFKWWNKEIEKFDKIYIEEASGEVKRMGQRIRYMLFAMVYEPANFYMENEIYEKALYCNRLLTVILPEYPFAYYRLARDYARKYDEENFIINLEKAIEKGLDDKNRIESTKEFIPFLNKEAYKNLMNKYFD